MRIIKFDCFSGISGDMTLGAFLDAGLDKNILLGLPQKLNLPTVEIKIKTVVKNGLTAVKVDVLYPHEHVHRHLKDIEAIIDGGKISERAKHIAKQIFHKLAGAEARVHNTTLEKVHFHEVGALDAIIDIVGVAVAYDALEIKQAFCSAIAVGGGMIDIAHGRYPVPAPATAYLLENFTISQGPVKKELVTPTGAAILSTLIDPEEQGTIPEFKVTQIGYGAGSSDIKLIPNVLRVMIGEAATDMDGDQLLLIESNIDDMNPELLPHLLEQVMQAGAVESFLTPVIMKKGRPGFVFTAICHYAKEYQVMNALFKESTTIGIRKYRIDRNKLQRTARQMQTSLGSINVKEIHLMDGTMRRTPEYEDCKKIALERQESLVKVQEKLFAEINQLSAQIELNNTAS